jgi:hypothetical protein
MKRLFTFLFLVSIGYQVCAQKAIFVRVYNINGKKINTGRVLAATDTSLQLKMENRDTVNISINTIGRIKTKRSAGHNVLMGSVAAAGAFAIYGAATADPDEFLGYTAMEGAVGGMVLGIPVGAAIGGITVLFKKSGTFVINGNIEKWKAFHSYISGN